MSTERFSLFALGLLVGLASAMPASAAKRTYCCDDAKGRRICGDTLPDQCEGRAYRLTDEKGVTKHVDAPLTAEQRAQKEAQETRKKEDDRIAAEQRRRDLALLNTYSNERDIDVARDRGVADLEKLLKESQDKLDAALRRRKGFDKELEFYPKPKKPPEALLARIKENDEEIAGQQKAVEDRKRDIELLRLKFEDERKRYRTLLEQGSGQGAAVHPAAMPRR